MEYPLQGFSFLQFVENENRISCFNDIVISRIRVFFEE